MSRQSEKGLIGCLLIDENSIDEVAPYVTQGMFKDEMYGAIYEVYRDGFDKGNRANEITVRWMLEDKYPIEILDKELVACVESVVSSVEIKTYADTIIKDFKASQADALLQHTEIKGANVVESVSEVISELQKIIDEDTSESRSVSEIVHNVKGDYFCDKNKKHLKTGFYSIDDLLGDLEGGDVIIFGARPAVGKSALILQIASNMVKQGNKIAFYNLEMTEKQIYERLLSSLTGLEIKRIKRAVSYTKDEKELVDRANAILERDYKNLVISTGSKNMSQIRAECQHKDYDAIIIDYLQLIIPEGTYRGNRFAEVGEISRKLKALAKDMKIPVIALSQLNRVSDETKEPTMSELREAGNIEQDASIIMLMWNLNEERTEKGIKIDKNRQGKTGRMEFMFDGEKMKFIDKGDWQDSTDYPFS